MGHVIAAEGIQTQAGGAPEAARTRFRENEGYRVLRFWNNEILENLEGVHAAIGDALGCVIPTQPSPLKGEGSKNGLYARRRS